MVNLFLPNKIDVIGKYRDLSNGSKVIIPPEADPNDPPFIGLNEAQMEHAAGNVLFVDSRPVEEFECGTIPGAINVPFDSLPEGDLNPYFDSLLKVPKNYHIITFCSGEECELSLHLARNLKLLEYTNLAIFFGGSREWEAFGLVMQRRKQCGE
jgi:rhodanese-related sulfurtransferase